MKKSLLFLSISFLLLAANPVSAQCTGYTVPHFEDFQGISNYNELPTCWEASDLGTGCLTFTNTATGANRAAFYYTPPGSNYFFSPGFALQAGIVYSVNIFYATGSSSAQNWTELSLLVGPTQTSVGMTAFATNTAPAAFIFAPMSGTFSVLSNGDYYVGIKATTNGFGFSQLLNWDDFSITIPCTLNQPLSIGLSASSTTLCSGSSLTIQASGADTYTWNGGSHGSTFITSPLNSNSFGVSGTSTLSGCTKQNSIFINVLPVPNTYLFASTGQVCAGLPITLSAGGADTYSWSAPGSGSQIVVYPPVSGVYSVTGINQNGCSSVASIVVQVLNLPGVHVYEHKDSVCAGDAISLFGIGASTYTWITSTGNKFVNPLQVSINTSATFTLVGRNGFGCENKDVTTVYAKECVSINEESRAGGNVVFPNPAAISFFVTHQPGTELRMYDISGKPTSVKIIRESENGSELDIQHLPSGIYFIETRLNGRVDRVKLVKAP